MSSSWGVIGRRDARSISGTLGLHKILFAYLEVAMSS